MKEMFSLSTSIDTTKLKPAFVDSKETIADHNKKSVCLYYI